MIYLLSIYYQHDLITQSSRLHSTVTTDKERIRINFFIKQFKTLTCL